jgi:hypothetical protein
MGGGKIIQKLTFQGSPQKDEGGQQPTSELFSF